MKVKEVLRALVELAIENPELLEKDFELRITNEKTAEEINGSVEYIIKNEAICLI